MKAQAVKLDWETVGKLKDLDINIWWVKLKSYNDKVNHLMYYFINKNK